MTTETAEGKLLALVEVNGDKSALHKLGTKLKGRYGQYFDVKVNNKDFTVKIFSSQRTGDKEFNKRTFENFVRDIYEVRTDIKFPEEQLEKLREIRRTLDNQVASLTARNATLEAERDKWKTKYDAVVRDVDKQLNELVEQESRLANGNGVLLLTIAKDIKNFAQKIDDTSIGNINKILQTFKKIGIRTTHQNIEEVIEGIDDAKLRTLFETRAASETQEYKKASREKEEAENALNMFKDKNSDFAKSMIVKATNTIRAQQKVIDEYEKKLKEYLASSRKTLSETEFKKGIAVDGEYPFLLYTNKDELRLYLPVSETNGNKLAELILKNIGLKFVQSEGFWKTEVSGNMRAVVDNVEKRILSTLREYCINGHSMRHTKVYADLKDVAEEDLDDKIDTEPVSVSDRNNPTIEAPKYRRHWTQEQYETIKNLLLSTNKAYTRREITDMIFTEPQPQYDFSVKDATLSILLTLRRQSFIEKIGVPRSNRTMYTNLKHYNALYEEKVREIISKGFNEGKFRLKSMTNTLKNAGYETPNKEYLRVALNKLVDDGTLILEKRTYIIRNYAVQEISRQTPTDKLKKQIYADLSSKNEGLSLNEVIDRIKTNHSIESGIDMVDMVDMVKKVILNLRREGKVITNGEFETDKLKYLVRK